MEKSSMSINQLATTTPKGFIVIDAVTTDKFPSETILMRNKQTNIYTLYNDNTFTSCDQHEAKKYEKGIIENALVEYDSNISDTYIAKLQEQYGYDRFDDILAEFTREWEDAECDEEGATPEQDVILDKILSDTAQEILDRITNPIKAARKSVGITQRTLSELLEIPIRTIEDWDRGKRNPPRYVEKLIIEKILSFGEIRE